MWYWLLLPAPTPKGATRDARLPKTGDAWPEAERKLWLQLLEGSFKLIYKDAAPTKLRPPPGDAEYREAHGMPPNDDALLEAATNLAWKEDGQK